MYSERQKKIYQKVLCLIEELLYLDVLGMVYYKRIDIGTDLISFRYKWSSFTSYVMPLRRREDTLICLL